jgi:hypothetical protein
MGPALLIQGENRDEAIVLLPREGSAEAEEGLRDLARRSAPVALFGRGGGRLSGVFGDSTTEGDAECRVRPLRDVTGGSGTDSWAVGFIGDGKVAPLALDSVDVLSSRDSMALVAEASRLASAVTAVTSPSFQGLRFTVHDIRRFSLQRHRGLHPLSRRSPHHRFRDFASPFTTSAASRRRRACRRSLRTSCER